MRTLAIISDIHANLSALKASLKLIYEKNVSTVIIAGDVVGYGTRPNETCNLIRRLGFPVVAGNHDCAVADRIEYKHSFSHRAIMHIEATKKVISSVNLSWLKQLPMEFKMNNIHFVHSSLVQPDRFFYLALGNQSDSSIFIDVRDNFDVMDTSIAFVGHSHIPMLYLEQSPKNIKVIKPSMPYYDLKSKRAIVDVGSVGEPRAASKKASIVFYQPECRRLLFKRFVV